jgi:quinoprotein glucose dehydrogenase
VNIDGGAAVDVETGMMYVGSQTGLTTISLQKDPCSEFRYSSPRDNCGKPGALPPPPGYVKPTEEVGGFARRGGNFTTIRFAPGPQGTVSILKPKEFGGITAYDMKTGDKRWWSPNGGYLAPQKADTGIFAGVNLPLRASPGQAQILVTKTLVIYGPGRNGRRGNNELNPYLFAVDKATGRQVGAVRVPSQSSALPMTFMHEGRQFIVFATGANRSNALIALALPR